MAMLKLKCWVRTSDVLRGSTSDMTANMFCSCQYVSSRIGSVSLWEFVGLKAEEMYNPSGMLRCAAEKILSNSRRIGSL